jgi:hypothetical protein
MGIPVVFLYDAAKRDDYRVKIINDLVGIHYVHENGVSARMRNRALSGRIDWSPVALDIEVMKADIRQQFAAALERVMGAN